MRGAALIALVFYLIWNFDGVLIAGFDHIPVLSMSEKTDEVPNEGRDRITLMESSKITEASGDKARKNIGIDPNPAFNTSEKTDEVPNEGRDRTTLMESSKITEASEDKARKNMGKGEVMTTSSSGYAASVLSEEDPGVTKTSTTEFVTSTEPKQTEDPGVTNTSTLESFTSIEPKQTGIDTDHDFSTSEKTDEIPNEGRDRTTLMENSKITEASEDKARKNIEDPGVMKTSTLESATSTEPQQTGIQVDDPAAKSMRGPAVNQDVIPDEKSVEFQATEKSVTGIKISTTKRGDEAIQGLAMANKEQGTGMSTNGTPTEDCRLLDCGIHPRYTVNGRCACSCRHGYEKQGSQACRDVDECLQTSVCDIHQCHNTDGSFDCLCRSGYDQVTHDACLPAVMPESQIKHGNRSSFLPKPIFLKLIVMTMSSTVTTFVVVNAVLMVNTIIQAIIIYATTEPLHCYYRLHIHESHPLNKYIQNSKQKACKGSNKSTPRSKLSSKASSLARGSCFDSHERSSSDISEESAFSSFTVTSSASV